MLWNVQSVHQLTYTKTEGRKISQHYICVDCGRQFINFYDSQGYPEKLNANEDHIVSKTYMTRVEGANSRFRPILYEAALNHLITLTLTMVGLLKQSLPVMRLP